MVTVSGMSSTASVELLALTARCNLVNDRTLRAAYPTGWLVETVNKPVLLPAVNTA